MKATDVKVGEQYKCYDGIVVVLREDYSYRLRGGRSEFVVHYLSKPERKFRVTARSLTPLVAPPVTVKEPNAGTCCWCGRPMKLKRGLLVLHGFERPGDGWIRGQCFGVRTKPYEVSPEELPKVQAMLERYRDDQQTYLKRLNEGRVTELPFKQYNRERARAWDKNPYDMLICVKDGEYDTKDYSYETETRFSKLLRIAIANVESQIRNVNADIERVTQWQADWKPGLPLLVKD